MAAVPVVVDASVTMAWCFADEQSPFTDRVLESLAETRAVVPALWQLEVANVLLLAERRGRLSLADAEGFLRRLQALPIEVDTNGIEEVFGRVLALGRQYQLSAHDAAYLELALRLGGRLATQDVDLRAAAADAGVTLSFADD
jgi:predicted nucleic acid-binding protein